MLDEDRRHPRGIRSSNDKPLLFRCCTLAEAPELLYHAEVIGGEYDIARRTQERTSNFHLVIRSGCDNDHVSKGGQRWRPTMVNLHAGNRIGPSLVADQRDTMTLRTKQVGASASNEPCANNSDVHAVLVQLGRIDFSPPTALGRGAVAAKDPQDGSGCRCDRCAKHRPPEHREHTAMVVPLSVRRDRRIGSGCMA